MRRHSSTVRRVIRIIRNNHMWDPGAADRMQVSQVDISHAYFNARTDPRKPTYVELLAELGAPTGTCGRLKRHMCGTSHAAKGNTTSAVAISRSLLCAGRGLHVTFLPPAARPSVQPSRRRLHHSRPQERARLVRGAAREG